MAIPLSEIRIEQTRGTGPGGQRKNKVQTAIRATHIPTGITAYADKRTQSQSRKVALADLERKLREVKDQHKADKKKARRDDRIRNTPVIRTYNFKTRRVKDHRTGKTADLKVVLGGKPDLLH